MRKIYQTGLLAAAFALLASTSSAALRDGEMLYGSYDRASAEDSFGCGDDFSYTYDIAYFLPPSLSGRTLVGVTVPFRNTEGIDNMSAWVSAALPAVDFKPDTRSKDFKANCNTLTFTDVYFDEPLTIPEEGIYIGYSFTNVQAETFDQKNPVVISVPVINGEELLMFHVEGIGWQDYTSNRDGTELLTAGIMAILGDVPTKDQAMVESPAETLVCDVKKINLPLIIRNEGWGGVSSIEYNLDIDGTVSKGKIDIDKEALINSGRQYYVAEEIMVPVKSSFDPGLYPFTFEITKVNGENNNSTSKTAKGKLRLMADMPVRNPLIEEGTSVSCTWCPRGFYAIEVTNRLQPEAVTVVYHTGQMGYTDPMISIKEVPWQNSGLPTMSMDRVLNPESSADRVSAGLIPAWQERSRVYTPAGIKITAEWLDKDHTQIGVDTKVTFVEEVNNGNYKIEYVLLADDLYDKSGNNPAWRQKNGYAGDRNLFYEDEWRVFGSGEDPVVGLHFNNVCVLTGSDNLRGVPNSLPKNIKAYEPVEYMHVFDVTKAQILKQDGSRGSSLIQDKNKLRVAAFILNNKGEVVNATKCAVPGYDGPIGVETISGEEDVVPVAYYDLLGREVRNPENGIYIVKLSNGKSEKRVIR